MAMLEVNNLEVYYGVICALKGISFEVNAGEIVTLIGANGAGKTTTMQSIVDIIPKRSGVITFDGTDITRTPCHKIVHLGMTQVPEGRRIFGELTVYENLLLGAYSIKDQSGFKRDIDSIYTRFPRLNRSCLNKVPLKIQVISHDDAAVTLCWLRILNASQWGGMLFRHVS